MSDLFETLSRPAGDDPVRRARELSRPELPKRFYREVAAARQDDGYSVRLDGRPLRTPARRPLLVPTQALAEALAAEWSAQQDVIDPATMPLTRLVNSAVDGVANAVDAVSGEIARYAGADLLYYRADAPERLVARQAALWDPVVAWAERRLGRRLVLAEGIMHVRQAEDLVERVRAALPADPLRLAALHTLTTITGSVLLALAAAEGRITVLQGFETANVDEDWNVEQWGADDEATARRAYRRAEIEAAALVLAETGG